MKLDLGDKKITIRKWKGKDKKLFLKLLNDQNASKTDIMQALVYNCVEEDVVLSIDEFRYVLSRIRSHSLGDDLQMQIICDQCGEISQNDYKITDVIQCSKSTLDNIKVKNTKIQFGEIKNRKLYIDYVEDDQLFDMLLRIKRINNDDSFTMEDLIDFFDELDIDVMEKIIQQFNDDKFTVKDEHVVTCCNCQHEMMVKFDELPNFFPQSWFE